MRISVGGWRGGVADRGIRAARAGDGAVAQALIPIRSDFQTWLTTGGAGMRRGRFGEALQVQQDQKRDPQACDLDIFRGRRGDLIELRWHDGLSMSEAKCRTSVNSDPVSICLNRLLSESAIKTDAKRARTKRSNLIPPCRDGCA